MKDGERRKVERETEGDRRGIDMKKRKLKRD